MRLKQVREPLTVTVQQGPSQAGRREIKCRLPWGRDPGSDDCSKPFVPYRMCLSKHIVSCKVFQCPEIYRRLHHVHAKSLKVPIPIPHMGFFMVAMEMTLPEKQAKPTPDLHIYIVFVPWGKYLDTIKILENSSLYHCTTQKGNTDSSYINRELSPKTQIIKQQY